MSILFFDSRKKIVYTKNTIQNTNTFISYKNIFMEPQETQISPIDILSLLEKEENKQEENKSTVIQVFNSEDDYAFDNIKSDDIFHLFQMDAPPHPQVIQLGAESQKQSPFVRFKKASISHLKFAFYYLSISTIVFVVLLTATNWSSYYTLISAYMNPDVLKNSGADILTTLDKSKITVYANEGVSIETKEKQEAKLKEKLKESNVIIREDRFSPKKLITNDAKINIDLDITPYDNRIIIPKIGKNIPLVDVGVNYSFDFDHMENIFMKELEKGIIRYPGTAKP